jgi:transcriptional regulator with XRE-family HTH domain
MATVEYDPARVETKPKEEDSSSSIQRHDEPSLHRIKTVRQLQGMSLRTAARQLGVTLSEARLQDDESTDLKLSELYRWQSILEVPPEELLVEPSSPLSRPVTERARLVRVMKTAAAILEQAPSPQIKRLAERLVEQLVEVMPELQGVGPWHSVGQRRSLDELGRIVEQRYSEDTVMLSDLDKSD